MDLKEQGMRYLHILDNHKVTWMWPEVALWYGYRFVDLTDMDDSEFEQYVSKIPPERELRLW